MCEFDSRCPIGSHSRGGRCAYSGRSHQRPSSSIAVDPWSSRSPGVSTRPAARTRTSADYTYQTAGGVVGSDAVLLVLLAFLPNPDHRTAWFYVGAIVAIVLPALCSAWFASRCGVTTETTNRPCRRIRRGIFIRCAAHTEKQLFTRSDGWALLFLLVAIVNIVFAVRVLF